MDNVQTIITIIGCILGGGGLSALITTIISVKKNNAETERIEQETQNIQKNNDMVIIEYVNKILKESEKNANDIAKETRRENESLHQQIDELNSRLQELMNWVVYSNNNYRCFLENELRKLNPDIELPACDPVPNVFRNITHIDA